ncbi:hypothetical protein ACWGIV_01680 [Streptomyces sp. NPDC054844]
MVIDEQRTEASGQNWTRDHKIALVGALLAALALIASLYVIYGGDDKHGERVEERAEREFAAYVSVADRACSKYEPKLSRLGDGPYKGPPAPFADHMRKKHQVLAAMLQEWRAISLPAENGRQSEVSEAQALVGAALRKYEIAANGIEAGSKETANSTIEQGVDFFVQGNSKARSLGFQVCPAGGL